MSGNAHKVIGVAAGVTLAFFLLSFLAWRFPEVGTICTALAGLNVIYLYIKNPFAALSLVIAELAMGGLGWWLKFDAFGLIVPVRTVLFVGIMGAWGVKEVLRHKGIKALSGEVKKLAYNILPRSLVFPLIVLSITVAWGMVWGFVRGIPFERVLLDANGWWYGLLALPLLTWVRENPTSTTAGAVDYGAGKDDIKYIRKILHCTIGASIATSLLTLTLYHLFIKDYDIAPTIYRWVRDARLGELTPLFPRGWRVFMQSQVWALVALGWGMARVWRHGVLVYIVITFSFVALVLSLSRSYWIGLAVLIAVFGYIVFKLDKAKIISVFLKLTACGAAAFALIYLAQFTPAVGGVGLPLEQRLKLSEPAGSSRMNQLKPLMRAIIEHPIIGSGFGTTATYKSADPRIVSGTAGKSGIYTTYAFEWGYLDMWLKIGLVGLGAYAWLMIALVKWLYGHAHACRAAGRDSWSLPLTLLCALTALVFTNITSPYLNHPLGIGFMLLSVVYAAHISAHRNVPFTPVS